MTNPVYKELGKKLLCSGSRLEKHFGFLEIDGQMFFVEKRFLEWLKQNEGASLTMKREFEHIIRPPDRLVELAR